MATRDEAVVNAVDILRSAGALVVSTGAGMSKESGIPTFRDAPNALWGKFNPEELASPEGFMKDPPLVWRWYVDRREAIGRAKPHAGHEAIAGMETMFDKFTLITQNIDDLHRKAGSKNLIEIHGNIFRFKCFDQGHPIETLPDSEDVPPRCTCGSLIRPDVVWYGELLPAEAVDHAYQALETCDAILVVGTSGTVYPAAGFPSVARQRGARVIEVNPEPTPMTRDADVFLEGPAGEIVPELHSKLKESNSD